MSGREVTGADVKVSGECFSVEEIVKILYENCEVIHSSRMIYHDADNGCHRFLTMRGVIPDE